MIVLLREARLFGATSLTSEYVRTILLQVTKIQFKTKLGEK